MISLCLNTNNSFFKQKQVRSQKYGQLWAKESNLITKPFAECLAHPGSSTNTKNPLMSKLKQHGVAANRQEAAIAAAGRPCCDVTF